MDLDRNSPSGKQKYAIVNLRKIEGNPQTAEELAAAILKNPEAVEFGGVGDPNEFFVIKLKDQHAKAALNGYAADVADESDWGYAEQIFELAERAGSSHLHCKKPD